MASDEFKSRIRPDWRQTLLDILAQARRLGAQAVLACDLDSTLFDNRPRQARILREFGLARGVEALKGCTPRHWASGWDMKAAMRECGLPASEAEALFPEARAFWLERFFTSAYCVEDVAIAGAVAFTHAVVATGAQFAYVTGRHEGMRAGTVEAMRLTGMAPPGGSVHLLMKASLEQHDDDFKRVAHARLEMMGRVIAAFDNEPTHANDYQRRFPEATVVHLATDHSGRPVTLLDAVVSVPHFSLEP